MDLTEYLKQNKKTHIIFDLDRTLAHLLIDWGTYRREVFDVVGRRDKSLMESVPFARGTSFTLVNKAVAKHGVIMKKELADFSGHYEAGHFSGWDPDPHLTNFIRNSAGYTFSLWSSNSRPIVDQFLDKENLRAFFETTLSYNDVNLVKPDAEGFGRIRNPAVPLSRYLFVGDSISDEQAARASGIDFFKTEYFKQ